MTCETVIGLEVHAHLLTKSKMFCGCNTKFGAEPNTQTCPVCLGMPGVLPVVNKKAVEYAVKMALAVNCKVNERSIFARKNYFYPDLPKGYQISQFEEPLSENGWIEIKPEKGERKRIGILRIHLEEDAGKSVHDEEYVAENESLIDLNRCGVPLIEIVSKPDMNSPREAYLYLTKIRQIVRWLDICNGNMEEGSLRCDANISLRPAGSKNLGVKTELKNMNSFSGVEKALEFEVKRQTDILCNGGQVQQETLLWDENAGIVVTMRGKEESHDYRYFPDPDLKPLIVSKKWINEIKITIPEMPEERKRRWKKDYAIPEHDTSLLTEDRKISDFYEEVVNCGSDPKKASNWIMGEILRILKEEKLEITQLKIKPCDLTDIISMVENGTITHTSGKKVLNESVRTGKKPKIVVKELGLTQISDETELEKIVNKVIKTYPDEVEKYLNGKNQLFSFFIGEIMKATKGKANPNVVNKLIKMKMAHLSSRLVSKNMN
jgi:aspartyl-tRNA(Asn)/glutamyl-tRNA(Gln) amidotransferase subunit B